MPTFEWKGSRGRTDAERRPRGRLERRGRRRSCAGSSIDVTVDHGEGQGDRASRSSAAGVAAAAHRHLHAPVLGHDRRRPAARAVPRDPRLASRRTRPSSASSSRSGRTSSRAPTSPTRCASIRRSSTTSTPTWSPPARRAVSSTPSCSAWRLHREVGQAEQPGEVGDDLPGRRHLHRLHRRRGHSLEGHPGLRRPLQGPRRRAADADAAS